jgi:hypothetical protein
MSPKKKGRFDQKSPDGDTGVRHVPPEVQAPVDDMEDVGGGNDGEENNIASLSFGSVCTSHVHTALQHRLRGQGHQAAPLLHSLILPPAFQPKGLERQQPRQEVEKREAASVLSS